MARFRALLIAWLVLLGLGSASAQSLRAEPWPPPFGEFALVGAGFPPGGAVTLEFGEPQPLAPDGGPAPADLVADAEGAFRLPLRTFGALAAFARSGEREARLQLPVAAPAGPEPAVTLADGVLEARRGGAALWRVRLPAAGAPFAGPVVSGGRVFVGEGTTVVARELTRGRAVGRVYLSGPVAALDAGPDPRATVRHEAGEGPISESFTLRGGAALERVTYPPSRALLAALEGAAGEGLGPDPLRPADPAAAVATLRARVVADPTNPFHALFLGAALERGGRPEQAAPFYQAAAGSGAPFYVLVRLAAMLETLRRPELADAALDAAGAAWAAAGYDPGFAVGAPALAAWGDPLGAARDLFAEGNPVRGGAWLAFLRGAMPRFSGHEAVYAEYAAWLTTQGRAGEAADWRAFGGELAAGTPLGLGERGLDLVAALGLGAALALLAARVLLGLALRAKYRPAQAQDVAGKGTLARLRHVLPAYRSPFERLAGLGLLLLAVLALGVHGWGTRSAAALRAPALSAGTLGGAAFWARYGEAPAGPGGEFLRGLAAQLDRDDVRAAASYGAAGEAWGALNNSGALEAARGNDAAASALYRAALTLEPLALPPAYNLGLEPAGYRAAYAQAYRPGEPLLAVPSPADLLAAVGGGLWSELERLYRDPWGSLRGLPLGLPEAGRTAVAALALAGLALSLLALLLPRPRSARAAVLGWPYRLLALLVPGVGLADGAWGVLLLAAWAGTAAALLAVALGPGRLAPELFGSVSPLGLAEAGPPVDFAAAAPVLWALLALLYAANAVALLASWRRRPAEG